MCEFCKAMFMLCSITVWWKTTLFFWHKDAGWVTKLCRKPELSRLRWLVQGAMQKCTCSFDCCLTDWADLTVGPTLSSEESGRDSEVLLPTEQLSKWTLLL